MAITPINSANTSVSFRAQTQTNQKKYVTEPIANTGLTSDEVSFGNSQATTAKTGAKTGILKALAFVTALFTAGGAANAQAPSGDVTDKLVIQTQVQKNFYNIDTVKYPYITPEIYDPTRDSKVPSNMNYCKRLEKYFMDVFPNVRWSTTGTFLDGKGVQHPAMVALTSFNQTVKQADNICIYIGDRLPIFFDEISKKRHLSQNGFSANNAIYYDSKNASIVAIEFTSQDWTKTANVKDEELQALKSLSQSDRDKTIAEWMKEGKLRCREVPHKNYIILEDNAAKEFLEAVKTGFPSFWAKKMKKYPTPQALVSKIKSLK